MNRSAYHLGHESVKALRRHAEAHELGALQRLEDFDATAEDVEAARRIAERGRLRELVSTLATMTEGANGE
jgi:hypothetical protein